MKLFRLQYVTINGEAREYIGLGADIMIRASTAMLEGETLACVIEDHKSAVEAELDAMEEQVHIIGLIRGGYQPQ